MRAANQADAQRPAQARTYPIRTLAKVLKVSASGYYEWRDREPSTRAISNELLSDRIEQIHEGSLAIYGEPKIRAALRDESVAEHDAKFASVGKHRVERLMRTRGLKGVCKRRSYTVTTERNKRARPAPDLVERAFVADAPNQLWVADMTYVPTWAGFIYLAVVLDVWSRRIVGWAIGETMTSDLVISALNMALAMRAPTGGGGLIHHSDQGSQYTSLAFGKRCQEMGVRPSMGSVGDAYDNAMAESFFASRECELLKRTMLKTKSEARTALFSYIEGWYNPRRRHGSIGMMAPNAFEEKATNNHKRDVEKSHCDVDGLPTGPGRGQVPWCAREGAVTCPPPSPVDNPRLEVMVTL